MENHKHYELVARALEWIAENRTEQPGLDRLADALGVSPYHLQRTFQDWAGVTPKKFLKSLTRQAALDRLRAGQTVMDAAYSAGLSGPGRLHDLMISMDAVTPGEVRVGGSGIGFHYGFGTSPFGEALVSWSSRGVTFLAFTQHSTRAQALAELKQQWQYADFQQDDPQATHWLERIFKGCFESPLPIWLRGSPFQLKVWEALLAIPEGTNLTYGDVARLIGKPGASRAVGSAIGKNPVAWIIPCHRVIQKLGNLGGYRWGRATKSAMIGMEATGFSGRQSTATPRTPPAIRSARANSP